MNRQKEHAGSFGTKSYTVIRFIRIPKRDDDLTSLHELLPTRHKAFGVLTLHNEEY